VEWCMCTFGRGTHSEPDAAVMVLWLRRLLFVDGAAFTSTVGDALNNNSLAAAASIAARRGGDCREDMVATGDSVWCGAFAAAGG
jgi:hypothetical protein